MKVEAHGEEALERVMSGELAATIHLLGAPGAFPGGVDASTDGVSVLALPRDEDLSELYHFTALDAKDLPGLIAVGESVSTYSVDVNLVAYAWRDSDNERTRRTARFVEARVDRLEALQGDASQPEWNEVSLGTETPNIDSSPMVERALAKRAAKERMLDAKSLVRSTTEADVRAAKPQLLLVKDGKTVVRLGEELREEGSNEIERLLDELDALLRNPVGGSERTGMNGKSVEETEAPKQAVAEPNPDGPGG